jgi:hypothetical protein
VAEGVHRRFTASVLTLQDRPDGDPLVLIGLDGAFWQDAEDEWKLRGPLLAQLGLGPEQLVINLSHTHAGSSLCRGDAGEEGGSLVAPYLDGLVESLAKAVRAALDSTSISTIVWGQGWCDLASNRDLPNPSAAPDAARWLCGWNPQARADGTLVVGRVTAGDGTIRGVLVNYACHPTTLAWQNRLLSPDWVGALRDTLQAETDSLGLFLQGASGELAPREQSVGDTEIADRHGRMVAYAVLSVLAGMASQPEVLAFRGGVESGAALALWEAVPQSPCTHLEARLIPVDLELKKLPDLQALLDEALACDDPVLAERLRRKIRQRRGMGDGTTWPIPLWCWRIGDAVLVAHPAEAYSFFQSTLRAELAPHPVLALNLCNGSPGYLPPAHLYEENVYPAWQSPFAPGSLETLTQTAAEQAEALFATAT